MAKKTQLPPPPRVRLRQLMNSAVEIAGVISQEEGGDPKSILLYALGDALGQPVVDEEHWVNGISEPDQFGAVRWKAVEDLLKTLPSGATVPRQPRFFLKETEATFDNLTEEQKTNINRNCAENMAVMAAGVPVVANAGVWTKGFFKWSKVPLKGYMSVFQTVQKEKAFEWLKKVVLANANNNFNLKSIFGLNSA